MKQLKYLILGVIGMIAFTATATTTAKLEDKQKTELFSELTFQNDSVGVVNEFVSVDAVQVFQRNVLLIKTVNGLKIVSAIVTDVGWCSPGLKYTTIHYKDKLLENYNISFIHNLRKQNLSIRSNS